MTGGGGAAARPVGITRRKAWQRWRRRWIRHPIEGLLAGLLIHGLRVLPIDWASALGAAAMRAYGYANPQAVRRLTTRLEAMGYPSDTATAAARRAIADTGRTVCEYAVMDRLWDAGRIEVRGFEPFRAAHEPGRPVICFSGHFANWELLPVGAVRVGLPMAAFFRPPSNRFVDDLLQRCRRRCGIGLVKKGTSGVRDAIGLLGEGGCLGILVDERVASGVPAPSLGRPIAPAVRLLARLATRSGALLLPARIERLDGAVFRLHCSEPIDVARSDTETAVAALARQIDDWLEAQVRTRPDQWLWLPRSDRVPEPAMPGKRSGSYPVDAPAGSGDADGVVP